MAEPGARFWRTVRRGANGSAAEADDAWLHAAARFGFGFVRLFADGWERPGGDFLLGSADRFRAIPEEDFTRLKAMLDRAQRHGLPVILSLLSLPGCRWRQRNGDASDYRLWGEEAFQRQAAAFWQELAARLAGHPAVVAFNPLNEPHPERRDGFEGDTPAFERWRQAHRGTPADLDRFYRRIAAAIRATDPKTPLLLDARFHASPAGFRTLEPLDDPAALYAFHFYEPWEATTFRVNRGRFAYPERMPDADGGATARWNAARIERLLDPVSAWARRHRIPPTRIVAAEFGCDRRMPGARAYLSDLTDRFEAHGWHWAFYAFRSADWDGMDYELGEAPLGEAYWRARDSGTAHETLIRRQDNPLWETLKRRFRPDAQAPKP